MPLARAPRFPSRDHGVVCPVTEKRSGDAPGKTLGSEVIIQTVCVNPRKKGDFRSVSL